PEGAPAEPPRQELARHFAGWAQPVQTLIQRLDPGRTNRIPIHDIEPLPQLVRGRLALLGDAAHSSVPDLGQGGCQAMEDGWVLAQLLLTGSLASGKLDVLDALQRYERARHARTSEIVLRARKRSDVTHGKHPEQTAAWYRELAGEDGQSILGAIVRTIVGGPL
ncbi:MAG TPA: FAD-dependent monooxygenase, partial [Polyangiaceae bacterium]|nr:FAD-dependent monooxygenase [Polyangiaceae bacterium]